MLHRSPFFIWTVGALFTVLLPCLAAEPTIVSLGVWYLGSVATGINDRGQVVGCWATIDNQVYGPRHARLWENGNTIDLGTLGGATSCAYGINNRGDVVGISDTANGAVHVFLWSNGKMNDLGVLGGITPLGINDQGQIIGNRYTSGAVRAFQFDKGTLTDMGTLGGVSAQASGINNRGQVVGTSTTADGSTHSFLWAGGQMTDLGSDRASGINDRGQIVGYRMVPNTACPAGQVFRAIAWNDGQAMILEYPGSDVCPSNGGSRANAINNKSWIVGWTQIKESYFQPAMWQDGVASQINYCVWGSATAINQKGQIIGSCKLKIGMSEQAFILIP